MSLNRRQIIAGASLTTWALAQNSTSPIASAQAQSAPAFQQAPSFYRYKIGDATITAIHDGYGETNLENFVRNAPLEDVRKIAEQEFFPKDKVRITFTQVVIESGGKITLVDTGNGDSGAPTAGRFMANFKAAGFDPAKVDRVVISHFHGDHINGLRLKSGTAQFPNAEIVVPEPEWAFWMDDGKMAQAPEGMKGAFNNVRRVFAPIAKDLKFYKSGDEVAPNLIAQAAFGHTRGHMTFVLSSASQSLMLVSDITNHPGLFVRKPDWAVMFDMDAEMARQSRRRVLDMLATERMQVAFYHAPFPATGHILKDGDGFRLQPVQWS